MGVALALGSAVAFGMSDFLGGVVSRRASPWAIAVVARVVALAALCVVALVAPGAPTAADLGWGMASGLAGAAGLVLLYRGLARGAMHTVAPLSALGAATVPVVLGVAQGERPALPAWAGFALAVLAVWLLARTPGQPVRSGAGVVDGALAGLAFGLVYVAVGRLSDTAGAWPLVAGEVVAVAVLAAGALRAGVGGGRPHRGALVAAPVVGLLLVAAIVGYQASVRSELVAVAGVVASLYPAVTVLLAAVVLGERPDAGRRAGLLLALVAAALMAIRPT